MKACIRPFFCALLILIQFRAVGAAEPKVAEKPSESIVVSLAVRGADVPRPALRYRFRTTFVEESPGNAAPLLLKAMFEIDQTRFSQDRQRQIDAWLAKPVSELTADEKRAMREYVPLPVSLEQAARRRECDWELPFADTRFVDLLLPEVSKARDLGRWTAIGALLKLADGEIEPALAALRTGFTLAQHTNRGETLINALVAALIVETQCRQIESLVELPGAPNLYWALTDLPRPIVHIESALHVESATPYYLFPSLKSAPDLESLTREQADRILHRLIAEFSDAYKFMGLEGMPTLEQKAWMNRATATAMVMANAGAARKEMLSRGWSEEKLDALSTSQMLLIHTIRTYEELRDDVFKAARLPYHEAAPAIERSMKELEAARRREALPLAATLLPAFHRVFATVARTQQHVDLLRCVEALRLYAAKNDGRLPQRLDEISETPLPSDPITGKAFNYQLDGDTATLQGAAAVASGKPKRIYRLRIMK